MKKYKSLFLIIVIVLIIVSLSNNNETPYTQNSNDAPIITEELQEYSIVESPLNKDTGSSEVIPECTVDIYSETEYKEICSELVYNDIDETFIGQHITKELILGEYQTDENGMFVYTCGATEDFLEEYSFYQHTYRTYRIKDCRIQPDFPIAENDVLKVYGVIDSISQSYQTGLYIPTINVYYIEYIRQYGETLEEAQSEDVVREERLAIIAENEYKDSLNSDYEGITKNVNNMYDLILDDYLQYCDALNCHNIVRMDEDFTGRHVSLHVKIVERKQFASDEAKVRILGEWCSIDSLQDRICYCQLYNERTDAYISTIDVLYFLNIEDINASLLEEGDTLIVYGELIEHDILDGSFDMLVRYYRLE